MSPTPQVAIQDESGGTVSTATNVVTVTLGANPGGSTLAGATAVEAVAGLATFTGLRLDRPGDGYTLVASAPGLTTATSATFRVSLTILTITTGSLHTCARTVADATYCWGSNSGGQVGDGTTQNRSSPGPVALVDEVVRISGGGQHTCSVTVTGAAYCWGVNAHGQLGDGTTSDNTSPVRVQAPSGVTFAAVSAGFSHTCVLTPAGAVYCWGNNGYGQLGDATMVDKMTPVLVAAPAGVAFTGVSAGSDHTCAITSAGLGYCWGHDAWGQLGDGDETLANKAIPVIVQTPAEESWVTITAGGAHTCGSTSPTAVYCWGNGNYGKLGDGTTPFARTTPTLVTAPEGVTFVAVTAGGDHSCGLAAGGMPYCWGRNSLGQIGDGNLPVNSTTPVPVPMPQGISPAMVSAGFSHTCGVATTGAAYCWGDNRWGQLGDGSIITSGVPVRIVQ